MHIINRSSLADYSTSVKGLTNAELHKEVWMLEEHVKHLGNTNPDEVTQVRSFLTIAKEEKETRMVSQGYQ